MVSRKRLKGIGRAWRTGLALAGLYLGFMQPALASTPENISVSEATLRAVIILKIIDLITWPNQFNGEINFCANGESPSFDQIRSMEGTKVTNQKAVVRIIPVHEAQTTENCHVEILGAGAAPSQASTLLVCDDCDRSYAEMTVVELLKDKEHIRFNLNIGEAKKRHLLFSVSLLELAKTVRGHK